VQHLHAARHAQRPFLMLDAEVAEAGVVGRATHRRPDAGVQAREDAHADVRRELDRLTARRRHELLLRNAVLVVQQADGLVRADDGGTGLTRDALRTPDVVEVRVPDQGEDDDSDALNRDTSRDIARRAPTADPRQRSADPRRWPRRVTPAAR